MKIQDWLPYVGTGFAGVALTKVVDYLLGMRKINAERVQVNHQNRREDFQTIFDAQQKLNESQQGQVDYLQSQIQLLKQELSTQLNERESEIRNLQTERDLLVHRNTVLQSGLIMLESAAMDLPLPMWLKTPELVMMWVNKHYENLLLKPAGLSAADYVGNDDISIWGEMGKKFQDADKMLLSSDEDWIHVAETVKVQNIDFSGDYTSLKWKRYEGYGSNRRLIGIAGMLIPTKLLSMKN